MITYEQLYLKLGNRKVADLLEPKVLVDTDFTFPTKSILIWNKYSEIPKGPTSEIGYLSSSDRPVVMNQHEYLGMTQGNYRVNSTMTQANLLKILKKQSKGMRYLKSTTKSMKMSSNKLLIMNMGGLDASYKYTIDPINEYHKWANHARTAYLSTTKKITGNGRHKFITVEVPSVLPTREILNRYSNTEPNKVLLKTFDNDAKLNILDFWKFLNPDTRKNSMLNVIPESDMDNVTILFTLNDKVTMLNLGLLTSTVKEYSITSKLTKYPYGTILKTFYIFINKFVNQSAISKIEMESSDSNIATPGFQGISNVEEDEDAIKEVDIDDIIDNEIVEPEAPEVNEEDLIEASVTNNDINRAIASDKETYDSLEDVKKGNVDRNKKLLDDIDRLKSNKLITKAKMDKLNEVIKNQDKKSIDIPGVGKRKLKDLLTINKEDTLITEKDITTPHSKVMFDARDEKDIVKVFNKKYLDKIYHKDIISTIYSLQNNDKVVEDVEINRTDNVLGGYEEYIITISPLNGSPSKLKFNLPIISKDGTLKMSGNTYRMRPMKADLVIRKITNSKVALSTYYGKLFVTKATFKKDDAGFWFRKQLLRRYEDNDKIKDVVLMSVKNMDVDLPLDYSVISRYVKSFSVNGIHYYFEYNSRTKMLDKIPGMDETKLAKIEKDGLTLVGVKGKNLVFIDKNNKIWLDKNTTHYEELDSIYQQLGIDKSDGPIEHASVKIYKSNIPVVILLSYYVGFTKLLKLFKVKYKEYGPTERVKAEENEYLLRFKDTKIVMTKDNGTSDMLFGGMVSNNKLFKDIPLSSFNNRDEFSIVYNLLQLPILYSNEIQLLESMFVDPISKSLLEEINEPTTFKGLLIRSLELLVDDNYINPNNVSGNVAKGYERIPGMVYNEIVKSMKEHNNKSIFSKSKMNINPYSVWNRIGEDSSTVLVDDLNPIAELKQTEDLTMLGYMGMNKISINRDARAMHSSEVGIVSEASKDSGDVGTTMMLSAVPNIKSTRGILGTYDPKTSSKASTMSTTAMLMHSSNHDDVKRSS